MKQSKVKYFKEQFFPWLGLAISGVFMALLCIGCWGYMSKWNETDSKWTNFIISGVIGIVFCYIPFLMNKNGRRYLLNKISKHNFIKAIAALIVIFICAIVERNRKPNFADLFDSINWTEHIWSFFTLTCNLISWLILLIGIVLGGLWFICLIFSGPEKYWKDD